MDFKRPTLTLKYEKDMFIRLKHTIKALISLYLILYLLDWMFYLEKASSLAAFAMVGGCILAGYFLKYSRSGLNVRLAM